MLSVWRASLIAMGGLAFAALAIAQAPGADAIRPNLESNIDRPLRYRPEGADFVIENGTETFNRPLYGRNTAFRVDGGDRPEFVMYLPGRGGNLRLGIHSATGTRWLIDAARIETRYRPGELLYTVRDPALGEGAALNLDVLALDETDGLILRASLDGPGGERELIVAFGGINGQRGARDGDIGTEAVPISQWFQLAPEFCRGNDFTLTDQSFTLASAVAHIAGVVPRDARLTLADARQWNDLPALLAGSGGTFAEPVAIARIPLRAAAPSYFALQRVPGGAALATELDTYRDVSAAPRNEPGAPVEFAPLYQPLQLPQVFARTQQHFKALRERVSVQTPDPFVNAAAGALNVAADAVWDDTQQAVMHGAVAWRARLLGWRGPYAMDELGWHDRARRHFEYWATRQNTAPIPAALPPAEEATNLARNPQALHSNGDLSNSHYDMNLVYIDALFRHLLWTGDLDFARAIWPVIERHLAWERRLFRREFGPDKLPLYEAYAAIWASDDLEYGGGGVTHASAYNWWHNIMAARLAGLLGKDAAPYQHEADLIRHAMDVYLWLPEQGMYAEYRDYLGLQRAHPAAALWSFYHVLDASGLVDGERALQMARYVDTSLPHLPVRGAGVPSGLHVLSTTRWMPYTWSTNNVVMGENMHAALGFWQAGRSDEAFTLFRGATLASMYMGISPGNVGTLNYLDVYRRESQRDFADGAGVMSRALIEGLFGVRPDALAGTLTIQPGWPAEWRAASLRTPDVTLEFHRDADRDRYEIGLTRLPVARVKMRLRMPREGVREVRAGARALPFSVTRDALGASWLEVEWPASALQEIFVQWQGAPAIVPVAVKSFPDEVAEKLSADEPPMPAPTYTMLNLKSRFNDRVGDIFRPGKYRSPRSPFASLSIPSQGIGAWAGHVNATADIDDSGLRRVAAEHHGIFRMPDGLPFATPAAAGAPNIIFTSQWDNYPRSVRVPLKGRAREISLLMAGSTNAMQSQFDNGEVIVEYQDGTQERLALRNPTNWWPIEQDYFNDDFQFSGLRNIPPRVDLRTGRVRQARSGEFKGTGGTVPGGAATVLGLGLKPDKDLRALVVTTFANEVVIGVMAATLVR